MELFGMWSRTRTHKLLKMLTIQSNPIQLDAARTANSSQEAIITMEVSICRKKGMLTATARSSEQQMVGIREERAARNIIISPCNGKRRPRSQRPKRPKLALVDGNDSHIIHHHHTSLAVSRLGSTLPPNSPTEKKHVQAARRSR